MTRALLHHTTRVAILIEADTRQITQLVTALTLLVSLLVLINGWVKPVVIFAGDFAEATDFTIKVMGIVFAALLFGFFGVKL